MDSPMMEADRGGEMSDLKQFILEKRDEGKVVYLSHNGREYDMVSTPVEHFIQQPADGILYDLNRLEEVVLTFMGDPEASYKWINDFAVALTIRALKNRVASLETDLLQARADVVVLRGVNDAADELLEVARLREDNELPHPADDPKLWTARMQDAWDELANALAALPERPKKAADGQA